MARDLTAGMATALQDSVIRPVLIGNLDILSDPVTAWTGPNIFAPSSTGDAALDGELFAPMAPFLSLSPIKEDQSNGDAVVITLSGHDIDEDLLRQIIRDKREWRGRNAWLWIGLLAADESSVIADPVRVKKGVMTNITVVRRDGDYTVAVTIDNDHGYAKSSIYRILDHARIWAADTFSTYLIALGNKPEGFTGGPINNDGAYDNEDRPAQYWHDEY